MFADHQPIIGQWARACPENFARAQLLAILSARQPFDYVGEDLNAVLAGDPRPLFAWKAAAWFDIQRTAARRLAACEMIYCRGSKVAMETELLAEITKTIGLGLIKGGFVAQMVYGVIGCIDSRNQDEFGIAKRRYREIPPSATDATRTRKCREYVLACRKLGGCAFLWDNWCQGYALKGGRLSTSWEVSAEHCRILGLAAGNDASDIPF